MNSFEIAQKEFSDEGCILLTTENEFNSKIKNFRVKYIATCGHNNDVAYINFKYRKTGLLCKSCKNKNLKHMMKNKNVNLNEQEANGTNLLVEYLSKYYSCKLTNEGCNADLIIRENNSVIDLWIPIQIKTTYAKINNSYQFKNINKNYKDMLIACICISENKIWLIPYNHLKNINTTLSISDKALFNKYIVSENNINKVNEYNLDYKCISEKHAMTPISKMQQREQDYILKRESYINFISYSYYNIQQGHSDFKINNKKIQEKVGGFNKNKKVIIFWLSVNNGNKEGKRNFRTYKKGENDYYWFHSDIDTRFWIVPEIEMLNRGLISTEFNNEKRKHISIKNNKFEHYGNFEWIRHYEFDYKNISNNDKERIILMFS